MPSLQRTVAVRTRPCLWAAVAFLVVAIALPAQIWSEEFEVDGVPDPAVWSYDLGAGGWGNNELQTYTSDPGNARVQNGHLVLTARRNGHCFTSARIRSQDKLTFQYGTVEARIQVPDLRAGLWPAFWTLGNSFRSVGWPACGEIDVLEMGAGDALANGEGNRRVYSTAHWDYNGSHAQYGESRLAARELDGAFHLWRMEWTPWAISTFLDGQRIWTIDISQPSSFGGEEFHAPHFFILNMAVGGNFTGILQGGRVTAPLPAEYRIDYIRIFDNGHTILGGSSRQPLARATPRSGAGNLDGAYTCSPPVLGSTMTAVLRIGTQPYAYGGLVGFVGAADRPFGNLTILVDMGSVPILTLPFAPFIVAGTVGWTVPIPSEQALAGLDFATQGVLMGRNSELGLTNAVDLRVGY